VARRVDIDAPADIAEGVAQDFVTALGTDVDVAIGASSTVITVDDESIDDDDIDSAIDVVRERWPDLDVERSDGDE
jgi:hypothetical protein